MKTPRSWNRRFLQKRHLVFYDQAWLLSLFLLQLTAIPTVQHTTVRCNGNRIELRLLLPSCLWYRWCIYVRCCLLFSAAVSFYWWLLYSSYTRVMWNIPRYGNVTSVASYPLCCLSSDLVVLTTAVEVYRWHASEIQPNQVQVEFTCHTCRGDCQWLVLLHSSFTESA